MSTTSNDPDQLRADIEATREQLGDTVEALAAKTDVKAQAQAKVEEVKANVDDLVGKAREASPESALNAASSAQAAARRNPVPAAAGGAFVLGFVLGRRRGRRKAG